MKELRARKSERMLGTLKDKGTSGMSKIEDI